MSLANTGQSVFIKAMGKPKARMGELNLRLVSDRLLV